MRTKRATATKAVKAAKPAKAGPPAPQPAAGRPRKIAEGALVEAALRVMEREGYAALTIRSLARELGTSHAALYNHVDRVEDIEALALQQLTSQLPLPTAGAPKKLLRAELLAYLAAAIRLLSQHPAVLYPPVGSASWQTTSRIGEAWIRALVPHAPDEKTARLALAALVALAVVQADKVRIYGPMHEANRRRDLAEAGLGTVQEVLEAMADFVLPALKNR